MVHIALSDSTLEALAASSSRIIANVALPEGLSVRQVPHSAIAEVSWLRFRFTDGSELDLWPETIATPMEGWSFDLENFILCAEFRAEALLVPGGDKLHTQQRFAEAVALKPSFAHRQVRHIKVCAEVECVNNVLFRVDGSIQMMLDDNTVELATQHPNVMPMSIGIQPVVSGGPMRSNSSSSGRVASSAGRRRSTRR